MKIVIFAAAIAHLGTSMACQDIYNSILTFYGWPDNSPPGAGIAYDCGRGYTAGGSGSYDDPLSMATSSGELNQCEVVYVPYLQKYVRYEDECAQCESDWSNGQWHLDIWTGSNQFSGGNNQINCEDSLTPNGNIGFVRYPDSGYAVDTTDLFDANSGACNTGNTYPNNDPSNYC